MAGRQYDHDAVLRLRHGGMSIRRIATTLKMRSNAVSLILREAIARGDERATPGAGFSANQPAPERDHVIVVVVPTTDRDCGMNRKACVSLPRLSFLSGWTGAAS